MKKLFTTLIAAALAIAAQALTSTNTFTFTPTDTISGDSNHNDLGDLDHQLAYTWGIDFSLAAGTRISGATITITNIWDSRGGETDKLFFDLLDNSKTGVQTIADNTPGISNFFKDPNAAYYSAATDLTAWTDPLGGHSNNFNFNYDFTAAQLTALTSYIADGHATGMAGFGLGFDPDCHYFNDGVSLVITTELINPDRISTDSVPEGGLSIVLVGIGFFALTTFRRHSRS